MKLHIIIGQRKCQYVGQYAPEALDIADENTMSDNPEWLESQLDGHRKTDEFSSLAVMVVQVRNADVDRLLAPRNMVVEGKVVDDAS